MSVSLDTPEDIANYWLRRHFVGQTFGCVRFWQFALVRPNDQFFQLASVTLAGDRLDLQLRHADGQGEAGVVSVWQPMGLSPRPHGVALSAAARLSWGNSEAWQAGEGQYRIRTPRGEGGFAIEGAPALTLEC